MDEENKEQDGKKKKVPDLKITELFLVKADWGRTFFGEIVSEDTEDGKAFIRGTVIINEGNAWSTAETREELGRNLDDICTLKLDYGLHESAGVFSKIAGAPFYSN